jgi:hypothetical protein
MQDKQKVTLYLPPELHRKLKISAAVTSEPMSAIAERAIVFYLDHPAVVDEMESSHGNVHQVYSCPECSTSLVMRDGDMVSLQEQAGVLVDEDELSISKVGSVPSGLGQSADGKLVPC